MATGGKFFASKRTWQAQINCWSTYALNADRSAAHLPQMMADITRSGPASVLVLSTPSWASPEAVQVKRLLASRSLHESLFVLEAQPVFSVHVGIEWI